MVPGGDLISGCLWSLGFTWIRKHWLVCWSGSSFPGLTLFLQKGFSRDHWELPIALLGSLGASHCSAELPLLQHSTHSPPGHHWQHRFLCVGRALHQHLQTNCTISFWLFTHRTENLDIPISFWCFSARLIFLFIPT